MSFLALAIVSIVLIFRMPVSLMPDAEVPELSVELSYPDGSPYFIENSILQPLRLAFQGLYQLQSIESITASGVGEIELQFAYGTDMQLAYINANEKMDQVLNSLPQDMERPVIRQLSSADIPVFRLQVTSDAMDMQELSDFGRFIISRRLEQVEGVSLVESNGSVQKIMRITPRWEVLDRYGISAGQLMNFIQSANLPLSQIKVSEGNYVYDLTFDNILKDPDAIYELRFPLGPGQTVAMQELVDVKLTTARQTGQHLFEGEAGLVFAIHKQADESFYELKDRLEDVVANLRAEYSVADFSITQNQFELLNESIFQLVTSILLGTLLAVVILFIFSGEWKSPALMGFLIPLSMLTAIIVLYLLGQSINIVSLSGILLGIGILIDNGIILIDNINEKRQELPLADACRQGVWEIFPALVSSTLTTLSVFVPLLLLGGVAGALFQAQLISLTVVLFSSLMVALVFLPVAYFSIKPNLALTTNRLYDRLLKTYKQSQKGRFGTPLLALFLLIVIAGIFTFISLPKTNLPEIERRDLAVSIQWSETLTLEENTVRILLILGELESLSSWEADIGVNQVSEEGVNHPNKALLYLLFSGVGQKERAENRLQNYVADQFPGTIIDSRRPKNPYDQLFAGADFYAIYKMRSSGENWIDSKAVREAVPGPVLLGEGFQYEPAVRVVFDPVKMSAFGLTEKQLINVLKIHFNDELITRINRINETVPVMIRGSGATSPEALGRLRVSVNDSTGYPLNYFMRFEEDESLRYIRADLAGVYQDLKLESRPEDFEEIDQAIREYASRENLTVSIAGAITEIEENQWTLTISIILAVLLLFVILTAQFESFTMPLIILAEIPISASGALLGLWITGQSLSIASLIGIIITLGIIVNDSILKVDTIRRYIKGGMEKSAAIHRAGQIRLKPIVMTSLTTILALSPVLFGSGFGADLQFPLAIAVIFGLFVGTICSIYLVPILYQRLVK